MLKDSLIKRYLTDEFLHEAKHFLGSISTESFTKVQKKQIKIAHEKTLDKDLPYPNAKKFSIYK